MQTPRGIYCHDYKSTANQGILYLSTQTEKAQQMTFLKYDPAVMAYLSYVICNNEGTIVSLVVKPDYQGNGYAHFLLVQFGLLNARKISTVTLDDMSKRCNKERNIYVNLGFEYLHPGEPEMSIDIDELIGLTNLEKIKTVINGCISF